MALGLTRGSLQEATTIVLELNAVDESLMTKTGEGHPLPGVVNLGRGGAALKRYYRHPP